MGWLPGESNLVALRAAGLQSDVESSKNNNLALKLFRNHLRGVHCKPLISLGLEIDCGILADARARLLCLASPASRTATP